MQKLKSNCLMMILGTAVLVSCAKTDLGLKDARQEVLKAEKIIVVSPSKNTWFGRNIPDCPAGKPVIIKVSPKAESENIYVQRKDGSGVVIFPIADGKCSVVTDPRTVAQYQPASSKSGGESSADPFGGDSEPHTQKSSWVVKGKTITKGMSIAEVKKLLGPPIAEDTDDEDNLTSLSYSTHGATKDAAEEATGSGIVMGAGILGIPVGGSYATRKANKAIEGKSVEWDLEFKGNSLSSVSTMTLD